MKSNNSNINNPFKVNEINLQEQICSTNINVVNVSKEEYDLMIIHDPTTIYVTTDKFGRILTYIGDCMIENNNIINKYYISIDDKNIYTIYMDNAVTDFKNNFLGYQKLIPICRYNDPQDAIDALAKFNKIGSHNKIDFDIYNIIKSYIDKNISTHEFIIGILIIFNFKEDPELQVIIENCISHNANNCNYEFPINYSIYILKFKKYHPYSLFRIYSDLYDLLLKYDFFKDKKYQNNFDNLDMSNVISEISKISLMRNIKC